MRHLRSRPFSLGIAAVAVGISIAAYTLYARSNPAGTSPVSTTATGPTGDDGKLIVHEWGTFTSFAGSDGVKIEFRPLADNDLPSFVLNRSRQAGIPNMIDLLSKRSVPSIQRMETPVTYFYTDREREVNVKVGFPDGLLTEFFPPVHSFLPESTPSEGWYTTGSQLLDAASQNPKSANDLPELNVQEVLTPQPEQSNGFPELKNSELDWGTITLIPTELLRPALKNPQIVDGIQERMARRLVPGGDFPNDYFYARETDSAIVHTHLPVDEKQPRKPRGDYFEKFLFYRGIGNFDLPLTLKSHGEGRFTLNNHSEEVINALFLFDRDEERNIRFTIYPQIGAGEVMELQLPSEPGDLQMMTDQLTAKLVEAGLYQKEAVAMVNTWRSSWFGEEGTRLFYFLPQSHTDAILPLEVQPVPQEMVRVMVGRLEIMTPERERRIEEVLKQKQLEEQKAAADAVEEAPVPVPEIPQELQTLGRFTEPALVRVATTSADPAIQAEAKRLAKQVADSAEEE